MKLIKDINKRENIFGILVYIIEYNSEKWVVLRESSLQWSYCKRSFYAQSIAYRQRYFALLPYVIETSFTYVCMAAESRVYTRQV